MADVADQVVSDEERAMARLEEELRQRRIAQSFIPYDPSKPVNCVDCSEEVSPRRLEAYPHTRRCTRCAADVELSYRRSIRT